MPAAIEWTEALENQIIDGILACDPIRSILKTVGVSESSFYRHRLDSPSFDETIARAQEMSQEREVDLMIELADQATKETAEPIKLRIWTRMWVAGKRKAKKYGDKQAIELSGSVDLAGKLAAARERAKKQG